ncbi:DUF234 domain-containing protein [Embleya scabrispora]|uniref:DUF234 domain-containing protein n=1 Tax=Embleya scabrispora TaxID=159449 RepID=UPI002AA511BD
MRHRARIGESLTLSALRRHLDRLPHHRPRAPPAPYLRPAATSRSPRPSGPWSRGRAARACVDRLGRCVRRSTATVTTIRSDVSATSRPPGPCSTGAPRDVAAFIAAGLCREASLAHNYHSCKFIVAAETPLSTKPANKDTRYRVTDPHLRLWLAFVGPHLAEIERGRGDRANRRLRTSWSSWRGRAVEPVVREVLALLPPERLPPGCEAFGGYWTRTNDPEIDIVAADRAPIAGRRGRLHQMARGRGVRPPRPGRTDRPPRPPARSRPRHPPDRRQPLRHHHPRHRLRLRTPRPAHSLGIAGKPRRCGCRESIRAGERAFSGCTRAVS